MRNIFYHPALHPTPLHVMLFGGYNYAPTGATYLIDDTISQFAGMVRDYDAANGTGSALSLICDAVDDYGYTGTTTGPDYAVDVATFLVESQPVQSLLQDTRQGYRATPVSEVKSAFVPEDVDARLSDTAPDMGAYASDEKTAPEGQQTRRMTAAQLSYILGHTDLRTVCEALNQSLTEN
jgi:hypothetical protein